MFQVHELSDALAKTSCSCIEDWDYEQDERIKVSYSLKRRLKIILMKLKMKMYELMYWNKTYFDQRTLIQCRCLQSNILSAWMSI